jgi:hypothetical protein
MIERQSDPPQRDEGKAFGLAGNPNPELSNGVIFAI